MTPEESDSDCDAPRPAAITRAGAFAPEDFYFEDDRLVFTAAYHLKRGHCCRNRCRHCPWGCGSEKAAT